MVVHELPDGVGNEVAVEASSHQRSPASLDDYISYWDTAGMRTHPVSSDPDSSFEEVGNDEASGGTSFQEPIRMLDRRGSNDYGVVNEQPLAEARSTGRTRAQVAGTQDGAFGWSTDGLQNDSGNRSSMVSSPGIVQELDDVQPPVPPRNARPRPPPPCRSKSAHLLAMRILDGDDRRSLSPKGCPLTRAHSNHLCSGHLSRSLASGTDGGATQHSACRRVLSSSSTMLQTRSYSDPHFLSQRKRSALQQSIVDQRLSDGDSLSSMDTSVCSFESDQTPLDFMTNLSTITDSSRPVSAPSRDDLCNKVQDDASKLNATTSVRSFPNEGPKQSYSVDESDDLLPPKVPVKTKSLKLISKPEARHSMTPESAFPQSVSSANDFLVPFVITTDFQCDFDKNDPEDNVNSMIYSAVAGEVLPHHDPMPRQRSMVHTTPLQDCSVPPCSVLSNLGAENASDNVNQMVTSCDMPIPKPRRVFELGVSERPLDPPLQKDDRDVSCPTSSTVRHFAARQGAGSPLLSPVASPRVGRRDDISPPPVPPRKASPVPSPPFTPAIPHRYSTGGSGGSGGSGYSGGSGGSVYSGGSDASMEYGEGSSSVYSGGSLYGGGLAPGASARTLAASTSSRLLHSPTPPHQQHPPPVVEHPPTSPSSHGAAGSNPEADAEGGSVASGESSLDQSSVSDTGVPEPGGRRSGLPSPLRHRPLSVPHIVPRLSKIRPSGSNPSLSSSTPPLASSPSKFIPLPPLTISSPASPASVQLISLSPPPSGAATSPLPFSAGAFLSASPVPLSPNPSCSSVHCSSSSLSSGSTVVLSRVGSSGVFAGASGAATSGTSSNTGDITYAALSPDDDDDDDDDNDDSAEDEQNAMDGILAAQAPTVNVGSYGTNSQLEHRQQPLEISMLEATRLEAMEAEEVANNNRNHYERLHDSATLENENEKHEDDTEQLVSREEECTAGQQVRDTRQEPHQHSQLQLQQIHHGYFRLPPDVRARKPRSLPHSDAASREGSPMGRPIAPGSPRPPALHQRKFSHELMPSQRQHSLEKGPQQRKHSLENNAQSSSAEQQQSVQLQQQLPRTCVPPTHNLIASELEQRLLQHQQETDGSQGNIQHHPPSPRPLLSASLPPTLTISTSTPLLSPQPPALSLQATPTFLLTPTSRSESGSSPSPSPSHYPFPNSLTPGGGATPRPRTIHTSLLPPPPAATSPSPSSPSSLSSCSSSSSSSSLAVASDSNKRRSSHGLDLADISEEPHYENTVIMPGILVPTKAGSRKCSGELEPPSFPASPLSPGASKQPQVPLDKTVLDCNIALLMGLDDEEAEVKAAYENLHVEYLTALTREGFAQDAAIRALLITHNNIGMARNILTEFAGKRS